MARLLATDLDGTLLRSDGSVSERTRRALRDARAQGRIVVLATGRPIRYVRALAGELGLDTPVICANGAVTYDVTGDHVVFEQGMDAEVFEHVCSALREAFEGITFAAETARDFVCEATFAELCDWPIPEGAVRCEGPLPYHWPPAKLLVRHPSPTFAEVFESIRELVGELATVTHSTSTLLEITAAGVDKGTGLARMADHSGLGSADVIAFGDMPNDVAMLEWAGRGVAMANAHPTVRGVADEVTASNDDDGVAKVVETLS